MEVRATVATVHPADEIDAIVFDMGGVFVIPDPEVIASIVAEAGVELVLDAEGARRGHYHGVAAIAALERDGRVEDEIVEHDLSIWEAYDRAYFTSAGLVGAALEAAMSARDATRRRGDSAAIWKHVLVENRQAFVTLASLRPAAVVTNNNGTAVQQCTDFELCQVGPGPLPEVAAIVDSGVLGVAKPDPRIFAPALEALGTAPARTLYVGDTVHADVRGARNAGLPVVQLDPYELHDDHDHWRLPDLVALLDHLT